LVDAISEMLKTFRAMQKMFEKRKMPIVGIRKLEVTYNPFRNDFHPHFHVQVSGRRVAEEMLLDWLKRFPDANIQAQDIRPADEKSVMELFKYFTKIVTGKTVYVAALDTIFRAIKGRRTFQPMGIHKHVSEDIEELRAEIYADLEERETMWNWIENDWYDVATGEGMTGYRPSENVEKLVVSMK